MHIVQVINIRWHNATAWYALYLSHLLQNAGHSILVVVQPGTELEHLAQNLGLTAVPLELNSNNPLVLWQTLFIAARLVREFKPDIINCHRGEGFFLWALLRKLSSQNFKLVRTRGDQRPPRHDALNRWLHARVADAVILTNKNMARHFLLNMRTPERTVWVIPGGVDIEAFRFDPEGRKRVRQEFGFRPEHLVIGLVGRFDRVKGQRELIEAIATIRLEAGLEHVRLFLIGFETATRESEVEGWLKRFGLEDIAKISGCREDVAACISALDLAVVASLWSETIARAPLEIMAANRPLLSTRVGVLPDLLSSQALVEPGDVPALTLKLLEAVRHPEFREELLRKQCLTISQLSGRDFLNQTLTLYQGLLSL